VIKIESEDNSLKINKNKAAELLEEPKILEMPDESWDNIVGLSDICTNNDN